VRSKQCSCPWDPKEWIEVEVEEEEAEIREKEEDWQDEDGLKKESWKRRTVMSRCCQKSGLRSRRTRGWPRLRR
jgi:hypothetical protein